jgi:hypothetical protein
LRPPFKCVFVNGIAQPHEHQYPKGHVAATVCIIVPLAAVLIAVGWYILFEFFPAIEVLVGIVSLCALDLAFGLGSYVSFANRATRGTRIAMFMGVLLALLTGSACGCLIWSAYNWDR